MKPESPLTKGKRCEGLIIDNGEFKRRWVDEITLHVKGKPPKTLQGAQLPESLVLNTGKSAEAVTVLELFYEKVKSPPVVYTLPVEPNEKRLGRYALASIMGIIGFHVLVAIVNAIAHAVSK